MYSSDDLFLHVYSFSVCCSVYIHVPYIKIVLELSCTMVPTHLSLSSERNLNGGNQLSSASSGSTATHDKESFMLSGSKTVKNVMKLKAALPFTADDRVNPIPLMEMLLKTTKLFDPTSCFMSNNPLCTPIKKLKLSPRFLKPTWKTTSWTCKPLSQRNSLFSSSP